MVRGLLTAAAVAAAVGGLYLFTISQQGASCEVCVVFQGQRACRTASAATEKDALQHATMTACALVTRGVTEDLACQRAAPERTVCR